MYTTTRGCVIAGTGSKVGSVIDRDFWVLKIDKIIKYVGLYWDFNLIGTLELVSRYVLYLYNH